MSATIDRDRYSAGVTASPLPLAPAPPAGEPAQLPAEDAATYASWFACLAEPVRIRLLHAVATATGPVSVGRLAELTGVSQATCSHHLRKLAATGFVVLRREGTWTWVTVNAACCTGLPHAADAVMGLLAPRPCCPEDLPDDVTVRALEDADWDVVRRIYAEGIATGHATFETEVPDQRALDEKWLPQHRWVAEIDGQIVGWTAVSPTSTREVYAGVGETSIYVGDGHRGRGIGRALIHRQVTAADTAGLWTLQTSIFPENRASIALHHSAGYRTLGVRERIGRHHGTWRDTIFLERRRSAP
ncbi:helix-turn-helix domain-containing GNAT family N-acetyltransferase [Actinomycetospora soli]|uniref:helix-turn-helix domain-containing GNAT family N-acetyltransferase n=1 Tax=Actinomycetospora soli TaxID=2893887 RepID=UPI001E5976A3|nr:metalloregulator ArsR/SmtB family transcription factor [Actinomycetospora soli]MCD2191517.1 metalloregulator ArsR/SmtB family transcription factor [Actinomycetospora soli]